MPYTKYVTEATTTQIITSQKQIDRIIQLAKLGADRAEIDLLLDVLRAVTVHWDQQLPLNDKDMAQLATLESKLRNYLITQDPLRRFTPESLETYLKTGRQPGIVAARISLMVIIATSIFVPALVLLLPLFSSFPLQESFLLTIPLFLVVLHIGIAWLFFSALKNFKPEFKRAFFFMCVGIVLFSVAFSHYVIIELLGLGQSELFRYGGLTLLDASCYFFMFIGLRQYAQLLKIKGVAMSWPAVIGIGVALSALAIVVPHTGQQPFEPFFDLSLIGVWLFSMFLALNAVVSGSIVKSVTPAYAKSMRLLHIYFIAGWVGSLGSVLGLPIVGQLNGGFLYILIAILGIIPQLLLLYAGYSFKKETGA
jgi:hypothetical protein